MLSHIWAVPVDVDAGKQPRSSQVRGESPGCNGGCIEHIERHFGQSCCYGDVELFVYQFVFVEGRAIGRKLEEGRYPLGHVLVKRLVDLYLTSDGFLPNLEFQKTSLHSTDYQSSGNKYGTEDAGDLLCLLKHVHPEAAFLQTARCSPLPPQAL